MRTICAYDPIPSLFRVHPRDQRILTAHERGLCLLQPEFPLIEIKPYRADDLDNLIELFKRSIREIASIDYTQPQIKAWRRSTATNGRSRA